MEVEPWHWWALGGVLVLLEAFAPGFVLIWLGLAALLTGTALWLLPVLAWPLQVGLFALLTVASVAGWIAWRRWHPPASDQPTLNRRAQRYVGQVFILVEPIEDGRGRVRIGDTVWPVYGSDLAAGGRVRVVDASGGVLRVEPASSDP